MISSAHLTLSRHAAKVRSLLYVVIKTESFSKVRVFPGGWFYIVSIGRDPLTFSYNKPNQVAKVAALHVAYRISAMNERRC